MLDSAELSTSDNQQHNTTNNNNEKPMGEVEQNMATEANNQEMNSSNLWWCKCV